MFHLPHVVYRVICEISVFLGLEGETKQAEGEEIQQMCHRMSSAACSLTDLQPGHLAPLDPFSAGHHHFMCGGSAEAVFGDALGVRGARVLALLQVGHREDLGAEARRQVLQSGDVLVHDLVDAQPPGLHRVLLEGPHKVCKHPPDPDLCQEVVLGNVPGERPRDAAQEAGTKLDF